MILVLINILNENFSLYALDFKTAFLNRDLNANFYVGQPKGYGDNMKCKLENSLHSLKQAPRQWYQKFLILIFLPKKK